MPQGDALWYKDAIIYETHVRAFYDSAGDGIGDFQGLAEKLDYLQSLGVTALWLLPFYPSPLKDDGYDIADYTGINPAYGTLRDLKLLIREAHRRGLRIITELVCNHTSDQHPWFQRARRAPRGSTWRNYYVWSDTPAKYRDARIIFKDFETSNWSWDPVAGAYYWHRFYSHQPDLNYDNPSVRKAIFRVMDFWLQMGIDGLRLDAVPYLFEREGTSCENLPETHAFLKQLRRHVDQKFKNRMLLAEANQWPEQAVAYFGDGDECQMAFNFPVMPRMFMAIRMEDRFPIIDILAQTPAIPESAQWALFLRNHDELTLEMVTDEERDYMYRVYARDPEARINLGIRRRLAPLLGNHRRRIELMKGLLFSLPGTPVIYYGDEIGMGDNIYLGDRNGVRTPMQWSADRNAGFSRANPQRLYLPVIVDPEYHYETVNVQAQEANPHSLLSWTKRLIGLRSRYKAFGRGSLQFLYPENRKVLAYVRRYQEETILVVANLSRFVQYAELNLNEFKGMVPVELWGQTEFPPIRDQPYFLTLGPHAFYWFALQSQRAAILPAEERKARIPSLAVSGTWAVGTTGRSPILGNGWAGLGDLLPAYLRKRRWFRGKARRIRSVQIAEAVPLSYDPAVANLAVLHVDYTEGDAENYLLPLGFATGKRAQHLAQDTPHALVARVYLRDTEEEGILYDALVDRDFCDALLKTIAGRRRLKGSKGEVRGSTTPVYRLLLSGQEEGTLEASLLKAEQSNTSVVYGDRLMLKLLRKLDPGVNPELEVERFLTEKGFSHIPPVAGALEYRQSHGPSMAVAILQGFVPNQGDGWQYTQEALAHYFDQVLASPGEVEVGTRLVPPPQTTDALLDMAGETPPTVALDTIGTYLETARLLGRRTAEMHLALASDPDNPAFAPEPFTSFYQRSIYQTMRSLTVANFTLLRRELDRLPPALRAVARGVLDREEEILARFRSVIDRRITAMRIRVHGDYHLGQVLRTFDDFVIIDFEGEPGRPVGERRLKRSPLRDVAGMLRSFYYASRTALRDRAEAADSLQRSELPEQWALFWSSWVGAAFLKGYLETAGEAEFLPRSREDLQLLLDAFVLEKAIYELGYELNNRPDWVGIPLQDIPRLLGDEG